MTPVPCTSRKRSNRNGSPNRLQIYLARGVAWSGKTRLSGPLARQLLDRTYPSGFRTVHLVDRNRCAIFK